MNESHKFRIGGGSCRLHVAKFMITAIKKWYGYGNYLPTVNEVQADDCLQMAIQSLVTEVSGWVKSILGLQNGASHITVVPEVFSYVSTPPKHCPLT